MVKCVLGAIVSFNGVADRCDVLERTGHPGGSRSDWTTSRWIDSDRGGCVLVGREVLEFRVIAAAKDTDENYLAVCQARETGENGLRLDAVGKFISITVLTVGFFRPGLRLLGLLDRRWRSWLVAVAIGY